MTSFERRQRMDERNRLRRMNECCLELALEESEAGRHRRRIRLWRLSDRIERRLADLAEELGLRW